MKKSGGPDDIKKGAEQVKAGAKTMAKGAVKKVKSTAKAFIKSTPEYKAYKKVGSVAKKVDDQLEKRYPNYTGKNSVYSGVKEGVKSVMGYSKGGSTRKVKAKK